MAYAAKMPYTYGDDQEEQTPDGMGTVNPVQPLDNLQPKQQQGERPELKSESGSSTTQQQGGGQPAQIKTFAQMQAEGFARPPMPQTANMTLLPTDRTQPLMMDGGNQPSHANVFSAPLSA